VKSLQVENAIPYTAGVAVAKQVVRVFESRVRGRQVHEVRHRQLADVAEPLEDGRIDNVAFTTFDTDEAVDGIANVSVRGRRTTTMPGECKTNV